MKRTIILGVVAAALSAASAAAALHSVDISDKAAAKLAGFEPTGEKVSCLRVGSINQIEPLTDSLFLVRASHNDYYLNETAGRCNGADRALNRLEYATSLSQLCRGELIHVVRNSTGSFAGSCALGDFERLETKQKAAPAE